MAVEVPWATLVRLGVALLVGWAMVKLWPEVLLFVLSVLLAITLDPLVPRLMRLRLSRGMAVLVLALASLAVVAGTVAVVAPPLSDQVDRFLTHLPQFQQQVKAQLGAHGLAARVVNEVIALPTSPEVKKWLARPLSWGMAAFEGAMAAILVFVFTFYLLVDGKLLYAWLLAYVPRRHRPRMAKMLPEVQQVISAYVSAQAITCVAFALFAFVVLTAFGVPAAVPLAALAFVCDVIPVLGIIIATAPAVLLGLAVSPAKGLALLGLYAAYHLFETYVLVPRLYGDKLRLSSLAVLLALVIGGALQGIIGAVLVLPFVAAYPVVERYWLSEYLRDEIVDDHQALVQAENTEEKHEVAEQVVRGEET